jgi:tetratricopeptide (TPR) repeat protein
LKIKLLILIPVILGFTYCTTPPPVLDNPEQTDISISIDKDALILEKTRMLIEDGSLASLRDAIMILDNESAGLTEQGIFLKFIAVNIIKLVYPYSIDSKIQIIEPKSSIFPEIIELAGEGIIADIPNKDVSFFTLLISSTSVLYTESDAVTGQTLDILENIYSQEEQFFLPIFLKSYLMEKEFFYNSALTGYMKCLEIDPLSYPAELGLIRILLRNGEYREALSHLEKINEVYDQEKIIKYMYADALIGNNDLGDALKVVSGFLALDPDNMIMTLKYSDILQQQGHDSHALRLLKAIESIMGESAYSIRIRSSILIKAEEYRQAIDLLSRATLEYPEDSVLRELYGQVLLISGEEGEGRSYLENSLLLNPDSVGSLKLLTEEAILSKDWNRAADFVEKLLEKETLDIYLRFGVEIYQNLNNFQNAYEYSITIINRAEPRHSDYSTSIELLIKNSKSDAALELLDEWIKDSESSVDKSHFYFLKSNIFEDPNVKLNNLRQALFENLQNIDAIIAIADAYYMLGEKRNAYRYLKQAIILKPNDTIIKERLRKLEKEL